MDLVEGPCPYLPERGSRLEVVYREQTEEEYDRLLAEGWRRSGKAFYRPNCPSCKLCVPLRRPISCPTTRRQVRSERRNSDLSVRLARPVPSLEAFSLYGLYLAERHGLDGRTAESFADLIDSPLARLVEYRRSDRLLALGFVDQTTNSLSSAYFAFDPGEAGRGLGTYSVYRETALAASLGKIWYYLGYWVPGCRKMDYKADFPPYEILLGAREGGVWTYCASRSEAEAALRPFAAEGRR